MNRIQTELLLRKVQSGDTGALDTLITAYYPCLLYTSVLDKAVNQNGVELVKDVDIAAFQAAVQPIYDNLKTRCV